MRRRLTLPCLCLLLATGGCVPQQATRAQAAAVAGCGPMETGAQTRLAMIRKRLDDSHPYAALAHLESSEVAGPAADDLRADILRRIGRVEEAKKLYQSLLHTCLDGAGHHGLGLLAGQAGDLPASLEHLEKARRALPADAQVRSDYGYALLLDGNLDEARFELLTARDLDSDDRRIILNLLLLFELQDDAKAIAALVQHDHITSDEHSRLRAEAARLQNLRGARPEPAPAAR